MSQYYKWLRQKYEAKICEQLRDAVDYGEMTEDEADLEFNRLIEEWEAEYGDYIYDAKGDR